MARDPLEAQVCELIAAGDPDRLGLFFLSPAGRSFYVEFAHNAAWQARAVKLAVLPFVELPTGRELKRALKEIEGVTP